MKHSYRRGYRNRSKSTQRIHSFYFYVTNITVDDTIWPFDHQVVILEVILYQWSTHTVMGTEIGVNPHGKSILTIFMYAWRCECFIDIIWPPKWSLEVKKVNSDVDSYVSDIKLVRMYSPCGFTGTHDSMSAPLIKYDLKNEHLEVKKVNSAVDRYVVT